MQIGYKLATEAFGPKEIVEQAQLAERAGFDFVELSDHYHPWLETQGHSAFTWSMLGTIAGTTERIGLATGVTCPTVPLPPGDRRPGRGHRRAPVRQPVHARHRLRRAAQRARRRRGFPERPEAPRAAARGPGDHQPALAGRLPVLRRPALPARRRAGLGPARPAAGHRRRGQRSASAAIAAELGTGLFATEPKPEIVQAYRAKGGDGPHYAEVPMAWAPDEDTAIKAVLETSALGADRVEGHERAAEPGELRRRVGDGAAGGHHASSSPSVRTSRSTSSTCSSTWTPGSTTSCCRTPGPTRRASSTSSPRSSPTGCGPSRPAADRAFVIRRAGVGVPRRPADQLIACRDGGPPRPPCGSGEAGMSFNLATILRESAAAAPDKPLLHVADPSLTLRPGRRDLRPGRVRAARARARARPDKVAVHLPNLPQFVLPTSASSRPASVMMPLNPLLKAPEIAYHLSDCDAAAIVTVDLFAEEVLKAVPDVGDIPVFVVRTTDAELPPGTRPFEELYQAGGHPRHRPDRRRRHRGPALHQRHDRAAQGRRAHALPAVHGLHGRRRHLRLPATDDVSMVVLPLFHVFGLSSIFNVAVRFGGSIVLVPRFETGAVLDAIERHRCTLFGGVPTMYVALAAGRPRRPRPVGAAGRRLRRRLDPRRGHPRVRAGLPGRRRPRGLRALGDQRARDLQLLRRRAQGALASASRCGASICGSWTTTGTSCRAARSTSARSACAGTTS